MHTDLICFTGKSAVVTGAASGIGRALCVALATAGARVYAADRNADGLAQLQATAAYRIQTQVIDVSDESAVKNLLDRAAREHGSLDYVYNNAGIVMGGDFEHMDAASWQKIIDINLWGVIYGTQHAYRLMREQGSGHIINTASTAGLTPVARSVAYAATKHAVVGLSTSLREEARVHGVRVSVAIPGLVDTGIFSSASNLGDHDYAAAIRRVPIGKISPQQAALAMLRGTSNNAAYIIFPTYNRLIVALHRWLPGSTSRLINLKL